MAAAILMMTLLDPIMTSRAAAPQPYVEYPLRQPAPGAAAVVTCIALKSQIPNFCNHSLKSIPTATGLFVDTSIATIWLLIALGIIGWLLAAFVTVLFLVMRRRFNRQLFGTSGVDGSILAGIIGSAMDGIVTIDDHERILILNKAAERIFQCSADEMLGKPLNLLLPERYRVAHSKHVRTFGRTHSTLREMGTPMDLFGRRANGEEFPLDASISHMEIGGRKLFTVIVRDITERKRAEEQLLESEDRFRGLVESLPQLVWSCSPSGSSEFLSRQWIDYTGIDEVEQLGSGWLDRIYPDDRVLWSTAWSRASADGSPFHTESRVRRWDGAYRWFDICAVPMRDKSGNIVKWLGSCSYIHDARVMRRALHESGEKMRLFVEHAPASIAMLDRRLNYLLVSRRWLSDYGLKDQNIIGRCHYDVFPEISDQWKEIYRRCLAGATESCQEDRFVRKNGSVEWLRWEVLPWYDGIGDIGGIIIASEAITERKRAEDALRRSEALFSTVFHASPVSISITQLDGGRYVDVNAAFLNRYGLTREEVIGSTSQEWNLWVNPGAREQMVRTLRAEGAIYDFETRFRAKSGDTGDVLVSAEIIELDGEKYMLSLGHDITARKRAEAEREKFALLVENSNDFIGMCDMAGLPFYINPAGLQMVGFDSFEEAMAVEMRDFFFPEDQLFVLEEFFPGVINKGSGEVEIRFRHFKTGEPLWMIFNVIALNNQSGGLIGLATVSRNITDRKQAEEEIRTLNLELEERVIRRTAELETANKELEAFSYSVSHDLRAPLRAIDGFSQALIEDFGDLLPRDGRRYLNTIRQGAQKMGSLIDDLLSFSRLSRLPVQKNTIDTGRLVQEVVRELSVGLDGGNLDVQIGELPYSHGDPTLLRQVWINLLANAIKYSRGLNPAEVKVNCSEENGQQVYSVSDNGTGFDMKYAHKLFGVFQRLHREEEFEGTGVGLAIVQRIIHRHGGRVWAEAEVGKGATFYFTLDRIAPPE